MHAEASHSVSKGSSNEMTLWRWGSQALVGAVMSVGRPRGTSASSGASICGGAADKSGAAAGAAGLAAVWARENTRESIWNAMNRREVYATTSTRITVRIFAGWRFEESDLHRPDFGAHGYANGVPMGGDLT